MRKRAQLVLAAIFAIVGLLFLHESGFSEDSGTYVGVEKCKVCHTKEYQDFASRKFTKAWNVLQMRGKTGDGECLKCHATGYGQGGFVSEQSTPHLKYKQCEACHGPGGAHANNPGDASALMGMKNYIREKDICIKCHVCMKTHKEEDF